MSKRPWERKREFTRGPDSSDDDDSDDEREIPFIVVDGQHFYSDRFYLNQTSLDSTNPTPKNTLAFDNYYKDCTCGARKRPPLLAREKLVKSLKLKAAIIATFSVDLKYMAHAYPTLCGPDATVPTLLLHGQKGLAAKLDALKKKIDSTAAATVNNSSDEDDDEEDIVAYDKEDDFDLEKEWRENSVKAIQAGNLGDSFHLTQVLPRYVPIEKQVFPQAGSWREVRPSLQKHRKSKQVSSKKVNFFLYSNILLIVSH